MKTLVTRSVPRLRTAPAPQHLRENRTELDFEEGLDFLKRKARDAGKQAGAHRR